MINWTPYLESVCNKYAQWWNFYTLTDIAGKMRSPNTTPLLTDLRVQAVKESREGREEKMEQYSVLEGLRKYAANHVLLVGRPGSGKSTAFARLLLEESEKAQGLLADHFHQKKIIQIPVLVELRYYDISIIDLIFDFLKRHDLIIDGSELETILLGKADISLLLLFDGVNELPSEQARLDLQRFRNSYGKVSMIFSTRDIGIGGDLNLEKKFEMLPLTEPQMKKFVLAYLPEKGEAMLKQLGDRLRDFGQTPLLLWMLCSVFKGNGSQIPSNLGLVFRQFIEIYDRQLKADVSTFEESREWWRNLLQVLAWKMTEGKSKTEIKVTISRREAELILTTFVLDQGFSKHYAKKWLDDLLKHHLIQLEGNDQISFRHQLIQEYYAAEVLLEKISELRDEELQWNYLNYLKWTEPFALMLGMIENKDKAIHLVKLALAVDVRLGARFAGEVKTEFQTETIRKILELDVPEPLKTELLGLTKSKSEEVIKKLWQALINGNDDIRCTALEVLCTENGLENMAISLIDIGSKDKIQKFLKALLLPLKISHPKRPLSPFLEDHIDKLFKINFDIFFTNLTELSEDTDDEIRRFAVIALGKIDSDKTLNILLKTLKDKNEEIRMYSIFGIDSNSFISSEIVDLLLESLDDLNNVVRYTSAKILGKFINCERVISELVKALGHPCKDVRREVVKVLGNISMNSVDSKSDLVIYELTKVLEDSNSYVAFVAVQALRRIGTKKAVDSLLKYFENNKQIFGWQKIIKAKSLKIVNFDTQSELVVIELLRFLENYDWDEYWNAYSGDYTIQSVVPALARPVSILDRLLAGKKNDIPSLVKTIEDFDVSLRWSAANAVGQIQTEETLQILLNALENPTFANANNGDTFYQAYSAISKIQQKLKYYQPQSKPMNQQVYISYNWQEDSNEIANQIVQAFEGRGIEVIRDKTHTGYKDSIEKFMQQIGQGQCVIAVISDRYLKSPNCMLELVEIAKFGDFYDRIFPIVLPDAKIYDDENRLDYYLYWEDKKAKLQDKYKKVDLIRTESIMKTLKLYDDIRHNIDNLTHTFKVMNTLNKDLHRQSEFAEMIQAVEAKLAEDSQNSSVSHSHD